MLTSKWKKTKIKTESGEFIEAVCPVIVSASRSTDIPAFYPKWFMNRLEAGYVKWINPFNQKEQYISFDETRVVVFWTKNAESLIPYLSEIDAKNINYYFQFTINDYEDEKFEVNVPTLEKRIETFQKLSEFIGKEKLVWRFDPLILTNKLGTQELLKKIEKVGDFLYPYTEKLVFSFADITPYRKVQNNLLKNHINYVEITQKQVDEISEGLCRLNTKWRLQLATCGEKVDLARYGIEHNKCIDDELMHRIFKHDKELMEFLGYQDSLFDSSEKQSQGIKLKDKGQRKECGCIISKDIGMYNTCHHLCVYCYANNSSDAVLKNAKKHSLSSESII